MSIFPENTLAKFNTNLHSAVSLQGEWEVALSEIIIPKSWFNIDRKQHVKITYIIPQAEINEHIGARLDVRKEFMESQQSKSPSKYSQHGHNLAVQKYTVHVTIPYGQYTEEQLLIDVINKRIVKEHQDMFAATSWIPDHIKKISPLKFQYNYSTRIVQIYVPYYIVFDMSDDLRNILGIEMKALEYFKGGEAYNVIISGSEIYNIIISGFRPVELELGWQTAFVYCDILEHVPVGDTLAPLLRTVDITENKNGVIHKTFDRPYYLPVQKLNFESLEIDIRDSFGRIIPFESGTSIVTLHFRRVKLSYFTI